MRAVVPRSAPWPAFSVLRNVLTQVDVNGLDRFPSETRASLEEAKRSDCVLRGGTLVDARRAVPLAYIQLPVPGQVADLELWLVDREAARSNLARCAGGNGAQ